MPRSTIVITSFALSAFAALPAFANATNQARVSINPSFSGGGGPIDLIDQHTGACDESGATTGGASSSGHGTAHTEYGFIRLTGDAAGSIGTQSSGHFQDGIVITKVGVPMNTAGTLTFTVRVDGSLSSGAGASASTWQLRADVGDGVFDIGKDGRFNGPGIFPSGYQGDPFGTYSATVSFLYGQPLQLHVQFSGTAGAGYDSNGAGSAAFGSPLTCTWLGISNVLVNGQPAGTVTIASESGTNWGSDLTPVTCDSIDFNGDGLFPDTQDIDDFLSVFSGGPCSTGTCGDIDFNNDGLFPDTSDIDSLLSVFSGGACV